MLRAGPVEPALQLEEPQTAWISLLLVEFGQRAIPEQIDTDIMALNAKLISVTPLQLDLTDYPLKDALTAALSEG